MCKGSDFSLNPAKSLCPLWFWFLSETLHVSSCLEAILKISCHFIKIKNEQIKGKLSSVDRIKGGNKYWQNVKNKVFKIMRRHLHLFGVFGFWIFLCQFSDSRSKMMEQKAKTTKLLWTFYWHSRVISLFSVVFRISSNLPVMWENISGEKLPQKSRITLKFKSTFISLWNLVVTWLHLSPCFVKRIALFFKRWTGWETPTTTF